MITIYTDGACSGNPGIGGWGAVIIKEKKITHLSGGLDETTNNQMELTAAIKALEYFKEPEKIAIHTDSKYVMNGIESWINNWKKMDGKQHLKNLLKIKSYGWL